MEYPILPRLIYPPSLERNAWMAEIRSQLPNESVEIPSRTRVVIVGGGVIGCSLAYHLAKAGWNEVVLLACLPASTDVDEYSWARHAPLTDDGRFMWLKWRVDGSEKVTYSPSADDSARLIEAMKSGQTLTVDVTPYSEGPVVVTYDLAGFSESLDALRASCQ